jgi:hypothetical protein
MWTTIYHKSPQEMSLHQHWQKNLKGHMHYSDVFILNVFVNIYHHHHHHWLYSPGLALASSVNIHVFQFFLLKFPNILGFATLSENLLDTFILDMALISSDETQMNKK